ncbi:sugar ABC transporter substrate-binding protein [Streptacidiphilus sp. EB129]|jgi:ABC-type xylose transport system substrate-binding protein|uniref:sugar ABC transporter substrate-binding protein n=1 Tax=Streptacidiphilus sp. EB129 TaxID=3156262 RepID=UPI003514B7FD
MNSTLRRTAMATAALSLGLGTAGCGAFGSSAPIYSGTSTSSLVVGLLLPDKSTARYEQFDKPLFESMVKELDTNATVQYANAGGSAETQSQQVGQMVDAGVKVLVIDAQDPAGIKPAIQAAHAKGVKIIAYDRLAQGPVDAYVSFDNEKVGELQGQGLLAALHGNASSSSKIVEIDGAASDPNAADFKKGFQSAVQGHLDIAYDASGDWKPDVAESKATDAINQIGASNIAGFYSANDGMAGGIITAMKHAGIGDRPIGGQDGQLDAVQRILGGTQAYSIYKAYQPEAQAAATIAVHLMDGTSISMVATTTVTSGSGDSMPAQLLSPVLLVKANIEDTVVADGLYTAAQICTPNLTSACSAAGIH